jgi:hypothetical protein
MKDEKKLDLVLERFYQRFNKYNTKVLKKIGEAIKQIGEVSPSQAYQLGQELKYGIELDDLLEELAQISGKSVLDVDKLLDRVAEENVDFAEKYYKAKNKEFVDYENNEPLQRYVETIKQETYGTFRNLANSTNIGFTFKDSNNNTIFKPFKTAYRDLIDEAVYNVTTGVKDYQSAIRNTINDIADSGVKIHEESVTYKSGYNRRIDSSVRQNILEGVRQVNLGIQERIGDEIGADGVEISVHFPCADDHIDIQGRQYSKKRFEQVNGNLDRPIGTYNCRHFIFSIIMGIDEPQYSDNALFKMQQRNNQTVEYEGKTYNKYEATQLQRKLETSIRKQKDRQIIARASGDKEGIATAQQKISQLTHKYNEFSKIADLPTYKNRLSVTGYKRVSTK